MKQNEMKIIERHYVIDGCKTANGKGYFINTGIWADGRLAYSRCDKEGNIIEDEEGAYLQVRGHIFNDNGYVRCLYMLHV